MKAKKIGFIHTSKVLIPQFTSLCSELMPHAEPLHVADDSLIKDAIAHGALNISIVERLQGHLREAERAGVEAIMVTCSSMGPAIEASQQVCRIPVLRVDEAMAELAVAMADRIGVIATVSTTLGPTVDLIERKSQANGRRVEVILGLCDGALVRLLAGEVETHDRMVTEKMLSLVNQVDLIVLAQASMARVASQWSPQQCPVPVLSSPRLAIEYLAKRFEDVRSPWRTK